MSMSSAKGFLVYLLGLIFRTGVVVDLNSQVNPVYFQFSYLFQLQGLKLSDRERKSTDNSTAPYHKMLSVKLAAFRKRDDSNPLQFVQDIL